MRNDRDNSEIHDRENISDWDKWLTRLGKKLYPSDDSDPATEEIKSKTQVKRTGQRLIVKEVAPLKG